MKRKYISHSLFFPIFLIGLSGFVFWKFDLNKVLAQTTRMCDRKSQGDANCDGIINRADFEIWKRQYNSMVPPGPAGNNANFNCAEGNDTTYFVDLVDFEIWRRNKGRQTIDPTQPIEQASPTVFPSFFLTSIPTEENPTPTKIPTPKEELSFSVRVSASADDVNQDGEGLDPNYGINKSLLWIGTGEHPDSSYTGVRFQDIDIPRDAEIISAQLQVYNPKEQWISLDISMAAETTGDSPTFSSNNPPGGRVLTKNKADHSSNIKWLSNQWITLGDVTTVLQEIVNRHDWQSGNSISFILKGTGSQWGRKFVTSYDGSSTQSPRLNIKYR